MAEDSDKTTSMRGAHGLTITELLALTRRLHGGAVMAEETAEAKAAREAAEAKAAEGTDKGKGTEEPTAEELAALGDAGKRALARITADRDQLRTNATTLAEKARLYDEQTEASKTEQQRKDDAAKAAEDRAGVAEAKVLRLEAALDAGLPHTMAGRLIGTTAAELKADAEKLKAEVGAKDTTTTTRRRTTTDAEANGAGPSGGMSALIRQRAGRVAS